MKTHTTILSIKLINKAVCLLFAFLALFATCEVQTALIVTRYNMTVEGSSHLVTLNAKTDGDPFNLAGDRTPYRTLIDVTSGVYNLTFVDTVPGFVAWSYIGSNHNNTNGIALGSIQFPQQPKIEGEIRPSETRPSAFRMAHRYRGSHQCPHHKVRKWALVRAEIQASGT